jgi:hypothetical protein
VFEGQLKRDQWRIEGKEIRVIGSGGQKVADTGGIPFHICQDIDEELQYPGPHNELNPQNASGTSIIHKKMDPS